MAKLFDALSDELTSFINNQKIFFVGTAMAEGTINVSPKGMDTLHVLDHNRLIWLNLTGSGNETATHILDNNRMTIMFCSFEKNPLILRLYGKAKVYHKYDKEFNGLLQYFNMRAGARQVFELSIDTVQTSCGFAVPLMEFKGERPTLKKWAEKKGDEGIREYWEEKNTTSLDGHKTHIFET